LYNKGGCRAQFSAGEVRNSAFMSFRLNAYAQRDR
jgi:hypothetical protein